MEEPGEERVCHERGVVRNTCSGRDWGYVFEATSLAPFGHVPDTYIWIVDERVDPVTFGLADGHAKGHAEASLIAPMALFQRGASERTFPVPPREVVGVRRGAPGK
jgi:hypothetical protein